jgi:hypothetical protein
MPICCQVSSWPSGTCGCPDRLAAKPFLERGEVVDRNDPAHPAAAGFGACAHGLAEGRLDRGGVVKDLDNLHILAVDQRKNHVPGPEARVHTPLDRFDAQGGGNPLRSGSQSIGFAGIRDMVQTHGYIVALCDARLDLGGPYLTRSHTIAPVEAFGFHWEKVMSASTQPRLAGRQPSTAAGCPG